VFWLLLSLVVVVCIAALAVLLLGLWRRVKVLGQSVTEMTAVLDQAGQQVGAVRAAGPLGRKPCPTCGAPASAATKTPAAVHG
jgi:hypothetical protein